MSLTNPVSLFASGDGFHRIARLLPVNHQSAANWFIA
jgi:hypothetical protein